MAGRRAARTAVALACAGLIAVAPTLLRATPAAAVYQSEEPEGAPIPGPTPVPPPTPPAPPPPPAPTPPKEDPDDPSEEEPDGPAPTPPPRPEDEDGPYEPAPEPTPEPPPVPPGGGGEKDGEPLPPEVRPAPEPDDPVLERVPGLEVDEDEDGEPRLRGLPDREDGTPREPRLEETVVAELGPLGMVIVGESCTGEIPSLDAGGMLRTSRGGTIVTVGDGVRDDSEAAKWLFSNPVLLATDVVRDGARAELLGGVPDDTALGVHVVQVTANAVDGSAYRLSLDVLVEDCDTGPLSGLRGFGTAALLALGTLLAGLLGAGWIILGFRRVLLVELGGHLGGETVPATAGTLPLPVASRGRREVDTELRGGPQDLEERDRALAATELRVSGEDVLDLDLIPVPAGSVAVIEADDVTWVFALRRPLGGFLPIAIDGLPTLVPGATLVVAVDGVRRGTRAEFRLGPLPDDEDHEEALEPTVLARLRADSSGRVRGEVLLPDDLGGLPVRLGIRVRAS